MKIKVYLKDPDAFSEAVDEAVRASLADLGLDADEVEPLVERRRDKVWSVLRRWVEDQEYLDVEFDTDAGTATVVEKKR